MPTQRVMGWAGPRTRAHGGRRSDVGWPWSARHPYRIARGAVKEDEAVMTRTIADLIHDRFGLPTETGRTMPAEGTVAQLLSHRVHRRYTPDPVSDETLEIVLAAALSAPSKSDLQQVGIVVVRDRARQATIGGWIPDTPWIATAPLFLIFCGDHRR